LSIASQRKTRATILWVTASFVAAHFCFLVLPGVFEPWNAQVIDQFFFLRTRLDLFRPAYDSSIVHLDISNTTIQELQNFYLSRSQYAQVIQNLAAMQTAAQVYDFIFAARTNAVEDRLLIDATALAGNVYMGMAFALSQGPAPPPEQPLPKEVLTYLDQTKWTVRCEPPGEKLYLGVNPLITFPALAGASRGLGFLTIQSDRDGVFRRVPLLVRFGDAFYPSISFRVVCDFLGIPPQNITIRPGTSIRLKDARRPGGLAHDIVIPIDRHGNMVVNYIGPWERMKHYNFADVFRAAQDLDELNIWSEELAGKIVVISDVSTGSSDIGRVPTDIHFPLSGLHASVMHTLLSEEFLRELPGSQMFLVELLLAGIIVFLALRSSSLSFTVGTVLLAVSYTGAALLLFLHGRIIVHTVRPLFIIAFAAILVTAYRYLNEEKEKEFLRRTFEAYFPPSIVGKLIANPLLIKAAGEKKELTILFSDIKNFTAYSATLNPDQIQRSLNEYFDAMVEIVFSYEGTVDKYIGDGLMVFFGDPEPQPDHAVRCVRTAMAMQIKAREMKQKWQKDQSIPIQIRIGINTGVVVVGNMGSARRLSYTVLGSAVNLAQRLESNAPVDGILISQRTHELVKNHVPTRALGKINVKGITQPIPVYEVLVNGAEPR
jgi:adenylate cyclase